MMGAIPLPADVVTSPASLNGIPVVNVEVAGADPEKVILYLHGGAYAIGSAASSVGLASDLARRAGAALVTVDYRSAAFASTRWRSVVWTGSNPARCSPGEARRGSPER